MTWIHSQKMELLLHYQCQPCRSYIAMMYRILTDTSGDYMMLWRHVVIFNKGIRYVQKWLWGQRSRVSITSALGIWSRLGLGAGFSKHDFYMSSWPLTLMTFLQIMRLFNIQFPSSPNQSKSSDHTSASCCHLWCLFWWYNPSQRRGYYLVGKLTKYTRRGSYIGLNSCGLRYLGHKTASCLHSVPSVVFESLCLRCKWNMKWV